MNLNTNLQQISDLDGLKKRLAAAEQVLKNIITSVPDEIPGVQDEYRRGHQDAACYAIGYFNAYTNDLMVEPTVAPEL